MAPQSARVFYFPGLNPEPWEVGPVGWRTNLATKEKIPTIGPVLKVQTYQKAIQNELRKLGFGGTVTNMINGYVRMEMFFWRRLDVNVSATGRRSTAKESDSTNMQKSTEDALQGFLFPNDRNVIDVRSVIMEQLKDTHPGLVIKVGEIPEPKCSLGPEEYAAFTHERVTKYERDLLAEELKL